MQSYHKISWKVTLKSIKIEGVVLPFSGTITSVCCWFVKFGRGFALHSEWFRRWVADMIKMMSTFSDSELAETLNI